MTTETIEKTEPGTIRTVQEIREKIALVEARLARIRAEIDKEMKRPFFDRSQSITWFLDVEKRTYTTLLKELKWIIHE